MHLHHELILCCRRTSNFDDNANDSTEDNAGVASVETINVEEEETDHDEDIAREDSPGGAHVRTRATCN